MNRLVDFMNEQNKRTEKLINFLLDTFCETGPKLDRAAVREDLVNAGLIDS